MGISKIVGLYYFKLLEKVGLIIVKKVVCEKYVMLNFKIFDYYVIYFY